MRIDIKKIKPNPTNDEIYTSTDLSTLKQSLERNGQLEPIVINKQNLIISGHRRYFSAVQLGWKEIEVRVAEEGREECKGIGWKEWQGIRENVIFQTNNGENYSRRRNNGNWKTI